MEQSNETKRTLSTLTDLAEAYPMPKVEKTKKNQRYSSKLNDEIIRTMQETLVK